MLQEDASKVLAQVSLWRPETQALFVSVLVDLRDPSALDLDAVDYNGCLINRRALKHPETLAAWFEDRFSDDQREYVLNHLHLWDVAEMPSDPAASSDLTERLRSFLPTLADFWRWRLASLTSRPFVVWTADDPEEYGPTIGFGYKR